MKPPFNSGEVPKVHFNVLDKTQLFIGRAVSGALLGEAAGVAINTVGKTVDSDILYTDPGNTAVAAVTFGLLYAIKQRKNLPC